MELKEWVDLVKNIGMPAVALYFIVRWLMRAGDKFVDRFLDHSKQLDASQTELVSEQKKISPQLERIETYAKTNTCRAPGFARGEPAASH